MTCHANLLNKSATGHSTRRNKEGDVAAPNNDLKGLNRLTFPPSRVGSRVRNFIQRCILGSKCFKCGSEPVLPFLLMKYFISVTANARCKWCNLPRFKQKEYSKPMVRHFPQPWVARVPQWKLIKAYSASSWPAYMLRTSIIKITKCWTTPRHNSAVQWRNRQPDTRKFT